MASFVPIMVATIMFNTVYAQMTTVFVEQVRPGCAPLLAIHLRSCSNVQCCIVFCSRFKRKSISKDIAARQAYVCP